jgi:hypothetical protein
MDQLRNNNGTITATTAHRQPQRRNNAQKRRATARNAHRTNAHQRAPCTNDAQR